MTSKIHPLTGEPKNGKPINGHPRPELATYFRSNRRSVRAELSYDAARSGTDLDGHWRHADSFDADTANNRTVRQTLTKRSRYEAGSNGYYAGIIATHCNMLVGVGPTLRMLTKNRNFNQLVEREFFKWTQQIQLRRKLWCMCHARTGDGEAFGVLQTNPNLPDVQLDVLLIETEQCQSPFGAGLEVGYIDGIKRDQYGNVEWYDILPVHPGSGQPFTASDAIPVSPKQVLHWFKLKRPGAGRGIPELTPTLNVGASSRRHREATVAAAETAADIAALIYSQLSPAGDNEPDPVAPYTTVESQKRQIMTLPMGWQATQMKGEHPNAEYSDFHRVNISEQARPLSMPYNAAACDSSTYSFASGKLDTLCYRAALDVERADCNDLVLDPLFAMWFREWTILTGEPFTPEHQWDWPTHPVIDAVSEATATDTKLKNGTVTLRQVYSDQGKDLEDELAVMAEDTFGVADETTIAKMRQIVVLNNTSRWAIDHVAGILGVVSPQHQKQLQPQEAGDAAAV